MVNPETWISSEFRVWLHYLANPRPDLNAEDPKKRETLLQTPISSQIRQVPTPIPDPAKINFDILVGTQPPSIVPSFLTDFFPGSWDGHEKVRLKKLVPLLKFSWGDLPICPFGGRKPFSTQPNPQIQDWGFPSGAQKNVVIFWKQHPIKRGHTQI